MGFGARYVGLFLGDESEGGQETRVRRMQKTKGIGKIKSGWIKQPFLPDSLVTVD